MGILSRDLPFKHALIAPILSVDCAKTCLSVLEGVIWESIDRDFYRIDVPSTNRAQDDILNIVGQREIARLHRSLESCFDMKLSPVPQLDVQRYCPGCGIGPHTDFSRPEVRLIINLSHGWRPEEGGIWILASEANLAADRVFVPPSNNAGFAFATTEKSFHALSVRQSGAGYALVVCLHQG